MGWSANPSWSEKATLGFLTNHTEVIVLFQVKSTSKVKTTFCWTREVAEKVAADYRARFGMAEIESPDQGPCGLDFGGMVLTSMPIVVVETAAGFSVEVFADQMEFWVMDLRESFPDRGGYVKIHDHYRCLCVPQAVLDQLREGLAAKADEAAEMAKAARDEWHRCHQNRNID